MSRRKSTFKNIKLFSKKVRKKYTRSNSTLVEANENSLHKGSINDDDNKSFRRNVTQGLVSTQQLPLDMSNFANHTFFGSAEVKTNVAFDKIINKYPFDGNYKEIEVFEDELSAYEMHVFKSFPKYTGFINLDSSLSQKIVIKDKSGHYNENLLKGAAQVSYLNPENKSFSIECHLRIPDEQTGDCFLFNNLDSESNVGYAVYFDSSLVGEKNCKINFLLSSGSQQFINVTTDIEKGEWHNLSFICDKSKPENTIRILSGSKTLVSSSNFSFGSLIEMNNDMIIADGNNISLGSGEDTVSFTKSNTFSGSIDEFRVFHNLREDSQIDYYSKRNIFSHEDLRLSFRFNEPSGSYSNKNIVLDHSGKSLHTKIENYHDNVRLSLGVNNPMYLEKPQENPILFPDHMDIVELNSEMLEEAALYDINNPNLITKLIPSHYLQEGAFATGIENIEGDIVEKYNGTGGLPKTGQLGSSQLMSLFCYFIAEELDNYKMYIDQVSELAHSSYNEKSGLANVFLEHLADQYELELPNIFGNSSIEQFKDRENLGIEFATYERSLSEVQNIIWRRILKNLNHINKTKGTIKAIESIFRSAGIEPNRMFRFVEFNGVREFRLGTSRQRITEFSTMLNFSGSATELKNYYIDNNSEKIPRLNASTGLFHERPFLESTPLSASRIEPGLPEISGGNKLAVGTIKFNSTNLAATPAENSKITIQDAYNNTEVFQFRLDDNADGNNIAVNINGLNTIQALNKLTSSIKSAFPSSFDITTSFSTPGSNRDTISLTTKGFDRKNLGNHQILLEDSSEITVTDFEGGNGFILAGAPGYEKSGISTNENDGLLTSGSWTLEGIYEFPSTLEKNKQRSVSRLAVKGVSDGQTWKDKYGVITNLVISSTGDKCTLLVRSDARTTAPVITTELTGTNFYNGRKWYISYGRKRNDLNNHPISSSFFIKASELNDGEKTNILEVETAVRENVSGGVFDPSKNIFQNRNPSGAEKFTAPFILIGSQSLLLEEQNYFLNGLDGNFSSISKETYFDGRVSQLKFWSKNLTDEETLEHTRNFKSVSVDNPLKNFTFCKNVSGSFEKLRMNLSTDQIDLKSNFNGELNLTDFSQNFQIGAIVRGFETNKNIIEQERFDYSILSPFFDEYLESDRIKIASFSDGKNVKQYNTTTAPVTELLPFQKEVLDNRFEIQIHLQRGLDEDIMNIFSTIQSLDDALGKPELVFAREYPGIKDMRNLYFNRLTDKVNYKNFFDLFRWVDDAFSTLIEKYIPRNTRFLGINLIIESHALERYKVAYGHSPIYIGEDDRDRLRSQILVSQRSGVIKRF